jgi:hypothetical protein
MGGIEITSFRLKAGLGPQDFIDANKDVDAWLRIQPGFVSRTMVEQADGLIVDMVVWESAQQAADTAQRLMVELADSPVHGTIDHRTVEWRVGHIFHALP